MSAEGVAGGTGALWLFAVIDDLPRQLRPRNSQRRRATRPRGRLLASAPRRTRPNRRRQTHEAVHTPYTPVSCRYGLHEALGLGIGLGPPLAGAPASRFRSRHRFAFDLPERRSLGVCYAAPTP